ERCATAPIIGPLFAHTLALPLGKILMGLTVRSAFWPQQPPSDYAARTGIELILRPREFIANAQDLMQLKASIETHTLKYSTIDLPTVILVGDQDDVISPDIHA